MAATTDYASRAELLERVGSTAATTILDQYLDSAAYIVDQVTRQPPRGAVAFSASGTSVTRYYDDYVHELGYCSIDDCLAVTGVTRGGSTVQSGFWKLYPYNELPATRLLLRADAVFNEIVLFDVSTWYGSPFQGVGSAQIAITGTWGYCTGGASAVNRPAVVKTATLEIAALMYQGISVSVENMLQAWGNPQLKKHRAIMEMLKDSGLCRNAEALFA